MKKILFIFTLLIAATILLHFSGTRDLGQLALAWDKYQQDDNFSNFASDLKRFVNGERVKEAALPAGKYADQLMYRWKDEFGQVHVSERKPDVDVFEEIRLGDLNFQIQPGLSQQEIDALLKSKGED